MLRLYLSTLNPNPNLRGEKPTENQVLLLTRHSLYLIINLSFLYLWLAYNLICMTVALIEQLLMSVVNKTYSSLM